MHVASQSMSSKYIKNSKLKSTAFQSSAEFSTNAIKNAHDSILNMMITIRSLGHKQCILLKW